MFDASPVPLSDLLKESVTAANFAALTRFFEPPPDEPPIVCDGDVRGAGKKLAKVGRYDFPRAQLTKGAIADSLAAGGRDELANLIRNCGCQLIVHRYARGSVVRGVNECKHALCPTAQRYRARQQTAQIGEALEKFLAMNDGLQGLLLTLTMQSNPSHELRYCTGEIMRAFARLMTFAKVKRAVKAYVRSVEFTRNALTQLWHIHIHSAVLVSRAEYFRKGSKLYITQAEWAALWRKALRATYTPIVDIRALKGVMSPLSDVGRASLREVIKYAVKTDSLVYWHQGRPYAVGATVPELYRTPDDNTLRPMLNVPVMAFADAVKGRRLIATSRNLQGDDDLDFTDDPQGEAKARDLGEFVCVEFYQWHMRGRDAGFYLVGRSFDDPASPKRWEGAMGP